MYFKLLISLMLTTLSVHGASSLKDCHDKIRDIVCLVNPVDNSNPFEDRYSRTCLDGGDAYTKIFEKHFDTSSPLIQRMYCSLDKIWIEKNLSTTAYAVPIHDYSNQLVAGAIGLNQKFLDENPKLEDWLQEKEESSFGTTNFINITVTNPKKISAVHYAINHEFGHIFDYANNIQSNWPKDEAFPWAGDLCFYHCAGEFISSSKAKDVYRSLKASPYPSLYATTGPKEDWAETFALYHAEIGIKIRIENEEFNVTEHLHSEAMKKKKQIFKRFIRSPRYP